MFHLPKKLGDFLTILDKLIVLLQLPTVLLILSMTSGPFYGDSRQE